MDTKDLSLLATQVRRDIIRMVSAAASGHPGGSLGAADLMVVLYFHTLKNNPATLPMKGEG